MNMRFEYGYGRIRDLQAQTGTDDKGKTVVKTIAVNGEPLAPTKRFWNSLHARFRISSNVFRYFSHEEVFRRISEVAGNDQIRWCIERGEEGRGKLLAVTNPTAARIGYDDLMGLLDRYGAEQVSYDKGVIRSRHTPRAAAPIDIAGDRFDNKYVIDTPIDGYGRPNIYLSLLRQICTNGAVAHAPAFRSELALGRGENSIRFALIRALDGFNNEDGFGALRQRFEAATRSWASVNETTRLYRLLTRLHSQHELPGHIRVQGTDGAQEPLLYGFHRVTGDLVRLYGLANLDVLSVKRQRTLPAACKVYDLLNLASELATHHATPAGSRGLQGFLGSLVSGEYDLEGTAEHFGDWKDFFVANEATTETLASMHCRS
jgi:hypothetical protein